MPAPAGDPAEEVDSVGFEATDLDIDLGRETAGEGAFGAAFEDDDVVRGFFGADDVEGDAFDWDGAGFAEGEGLFLVVLAFVEAQRGRGGEGVAEVEGPEAAAVDALHVGDDVAEDVRAEAFEAFRHERAAGIAAGFDVSGFDVLFAALEFEEDAGGVFAGDDTGEGFAVLGFDVPCGEGRVDFGVRVDDGGEEFACAVSAHACEVGADFSACAAELVAGGAGGGEEEFTVFDVALLFDFRGEFGDDLGLGFSAWEEFVHHGGGAFGDGLVRVGAEPVDVGWPEEGRVDLLCFDGVEETEGPFGAFEHGGEGDGLDVGGDGAVDGGEFSAEGSVVGFAHGGDEADFEGRRGIAGEEIAEGLVGVGDGLTETEERLGGGEASVVGGGGVLDGSEHGGGDVGHGSLEGTGLVPLGGERQGAAGGTALKEGGERGGEVRGHFGSGLEGLAERVEDAAFEGVGGSWFGAESGDEFGGGGGVIFLADGLGEDGGERSELFAAAVEDGGDGGGAVGGESADGGRAFEVVGELRPCGDDGADGGWGRFGGGQGDEGGDTDAGVWVSDLLFEGRGGVGGGEDLSAEGGVAADGGVLVVERGGELFRGEEAHGTHGPEGRDAGVGGFVFEA